jgi:hypothetical protein
LGSGSGSGSGYIYNNYVGYYEESDDALRHRIYLSDLVKRLDIEASNMHQTANAETDEINKYLYRRCAETIEEAIKEMSKKRSEP